MGEKWLRFSVVLALVFTFVAFVTFCFHFLTPDTCCGDVPLSAQWMREHPEELASWNITDDSKVLFIANQGRMVIVDTASDVYLQYKKISFSLECLCLNLTYIQLFVIWLFCEERKAPVPEDSDLIVDQVPGAGLVELKPLASES